MIKYFLFLFLFSVLSARPWDQVKKSGELRVAIRMRPGVMESASGTGFHAQCAASFAKANGLKIKWVMKQQVSDYFKKPFSDFDIAADNITVSPERSKKIKFIEFMPVRQVVVTLSNHKRITKLKDLEAETIAVARDSSYYENISNRMKETGLQFKVYFSKTTGEQVADLKAGRASVTILDSNLAWSLADREGLVPNAAVSEKQYVGWGIGLNDSKMADAVSLWLANSQNDGSFESIWNANVPSVEWGDYLAAALR